MEDAGIRKDTILIDLAVPRDMEPELAEIPGIELYTIDDFKTEEFGEGTRRSMEQAEVLLQEEMEEFYVWFNGRDMIPRIQEIREEAVTDLNLRLHKILHKPFRTGKEELSQAIDTAAGKVVTKMIFGLRDTLDQREFADCVKGLEKLYEE